MFKKLLMSGLAGLLMTPMAALSARAQDIPEIGSVILVTYNFCPRGTAELNGQLLAISQYPELYSLVGVAYGGDGRATFALPDIEDKVPAKGMHYCIVLKGTIPHR